MFISVGCSSVGQFVESFVVDQCLQFVLDMKIGVWLIYCFLQFDCVIGVGDYGIVDIGGKGDCFIDLGIDGDKRCVYDVDVYFFDGCDKKIGVVFVFQD